MSLMKIKNIILKSMIKKPVTKNYPEIPADFYERTRGHIEADPEICVFCGICAKKCPSGAIETDRVNKTWIIDRYRCIQCNCCVECCPKKCLYMQNTYTVPSASKAKDIYKKTALNEPEVDKSTEAAG